MIPWPDPPLRSGEVVLRPWRLDDAPALAAAWADEEIRRWTGVPRRRDEAAAERWIGADPRRRSAWLSLDLVVERGGAVAGEVGLSAFAEARTTAEIGWWTGPDHRGLGVATAAVRLVAGWAGAGLGLATVTARCAEANAASIAVARHAGLQTVSTTGQVMVLCRRWSAAPT